MREGQFAECRFDKLLLGVHDQPFSAASTIADSFSVGMLPG
jgi:hypothetical protein